MQALLWDFGDGNTSTDQNPTHTYTTSGVYSAKLAAENTCGTGIYSRDQSIAVGIREASAFRNTRIYPNPSKGVFELAMEGIDSDKLQISIYDFSGRLLFWSAEKVNGEFRKTFDLSLFSKGIYSLKLESDTGMEIRKVIIW